VGCCRLCRITSHCSANFNRGNDTRASSEGQILSRFIAHIGFYVVVRPGSAG